MIVGSAPSFPHGVIDPIAELAELARRARHRVPHRRLPRRLRAAVGRAARLPRAAVRLPGARRDVDVGGHAQVRLRGERHLGRALPGRRAPPPPVLHGDRLAGRAVLLADVRRQPAGRAVGGVLGGDGARSASRATSSAPRRILDDRRAGPGRDRGDPRLCTSSGDPLCIIAFARRGRARRVPVLDEHGRTAAGA